MSISEKEEIRSLLHQYFPQLAEPALQEEIIQHGSLQDVAAGVRMLDFGQYVNKVPLLVKGNIKVSREDEQGNELFLYYLNPGETCAMSFGCCMMRKKSDVRTITEEDSTFIAIPIQYVDEWMSKYKSWKNLVMNTYDLRMRELIRTIDNIAFKKMDERLINYLKEKAAVNQSNILQATHQEIAYDLNASRESISRLLKQLEKMGQIRLSRNKIELM